MFKNSIIVFQRHAWVQPRDFLYRLMRRGKLKTCKHNSRGLARMWNQT